MRKKVLGSGRVGSVRSSSNFMNKTSTVKLPAYFWRFQTKECVLRVNKSKITSEYTFNGDHLETEDNHEPTEDEETLFFFFLQICGPCFNP